MKKIYIIIGSIIAIVITLVFMKPLANTIEDMTGPNYEEYNVTLTQAISENIVETNYYKQVTVNSGYTQILVNLGDNFTSQYNDRRAIYDLYYVLPSNTIDWTFTYNDSLDAIVFSISWSGIKTIYLSDVVAYFNIIDGRYDHLLDYNSTTLQEGFTIPFRDILLVIFEESSLNSAYYNIETDLIVMKITSFTSNLSENSATTNISTDIFMIDTLIETPAQISGTTATLLNIVPFALISAIVITTTFLIKKEGD